MVPLAVLAASHVTKVLKRFGSMVNVGSVPTAMWWKVSWTQPPPGSALVTRSSRFCSVQVLSTSSGAAVLYGLAGGMVSAKGQPEQLAGERMSPKLRALAKPQFFTICSTDEFSAAKG
ncbi:hypothetical protein AHiyo1_11900 [Arthrobacter sp. Hiyo1]|nr:hypothetical protein AHiyo1_11900 [Arthrobacter sp. Hiyo1]